MKLLETRVPLSRNEVRRIHDKITSDKAARVRVKAVRAFRELRKQSFLCRVNFECCITDATYALSLIIEKRGKEGKNYEAAAYWHRQDEQGLAESGELAIGFGSAKLNSTADDERHVGEKVAEAMRQQGLLVQWNGSHHERIMVTL